MKITYPNTFKDKNVEDNYHGTIVPDPFRWLEDDNSQETKNWVIEQNKLTNAYLSEIPNRSEIRAELETLWNYERFSAPFKAGEQYFQYKNDGLQNQAVLYEILSNGDLKEILDPNKFSEDGTIALGGASFSKNGQHLAYQISEGGSDWHTVKILDLETGNHLAEEINWVKFSGVSWDANGFYYSRYPEPKKGDELSARNTFHKLYYHQLGTDQSQDQIIHEEPNFPNRGVFGGMTEDQRFLSIGLWETTSGNALYVVDKESDGEKIGIYTAIEFDFSLVDNIGDHLLILTNYKADNSRLILVDSKDPAEKNWKSFIEVSENKISGVQLLGDKILVQYMHNASSLVKVFDLDGNYIKDLDLPGIGTLGSMSGKKGDVLAYYSFTSFTQPTKIYSLDLNTLLSSSYKEPRTGFDPEQYITKQHWFSSKDGTKVPMFITHRKGIKLDGSHPTLLYGYGGFNVPVTPAFSVKRAILLQRGGIYVVANIRGGGEFGKKWHEAGTLDRKQNVFDDFIAAAEELINLKYTTPKKLAIEGGSNGGLLVGACMTQRPDLFAVAFPAVGVLDMLRYDKFTIGRAWAKDYGLSEEAEAFKYLYAYSPLHNIKAISYPATMVTTADHDDRVVPAHSFKYAANLQAHQQGEAPTLIRIETSAGHGAGKPTSKQIDEAADMISFMFFNM